MNEKEVFEKVKMLLKQLLEDDDKEMNMDTYLIDDLDLSSLEIASFTVDLETEFGIEIAEKDMTRFVQIKDIVEYLCK